MECCFINDYKRISQRGKGIFQVTTMVVKGMGNRAGELICGSELFLPKIWLWEGDSPALRL
jgi:hypothetical protein